MRGAAIAKLDHKLARIYIYQTMGRRPSGAKMPYHRFLPPKADDPLYEAISLVARHFSDRRIYNSVNACADELNVNFLQLVNLQLSQPRLYKNLLKFLSDQDLNKAKTILSMQPVDTNHIKVIKSALTKKSDEDFTQIEFGRPIHLQI